MLDENQHLGRIDGKKRPNRFWHLVPLLIDLTAQASTHTYLTRLHLSCIGGTNG